MAAAVEAVGRWWSEAPYFAAAERHMDEQWRKLILPFLRFEESGIDCAVVVELGAWRGRTAAKLLPSAGELHLVDLHANNLEACGGNCQKFRVWGRTMLLKEPSYAATQTARHPG
jgi:hypothetical protein